MERTERVELTTLCLIYKGDKILLQDRVKNDWRGYALPGGHVEQNESIVDAVIREMKEETGLTVINPRLCGIKQFPIENGRYLVFLFKTDKFEGEVSSSEEGQMKWIDRNELSNYHTVGDFDGLMQVLDDEVLQEFQYIADGDNWKVRLR